MGNLKFKVWEKLFIVIALILVGFSSYIFVTDFPLRKYIHGMKEEQAAEPVGFLSEKTGNIRRQQSGQLDYKSLETGAVVYNQDILVTGDDSKATLRFKDGSSLELQPRTMIRLSFQSNYSIQGVKRLNQKIDVVSGMITGKAGQGNLTINQNGQTVSIQANTAKTVLAEKQVVASMVPVPVLSPIVSTEVDLKTGHSPMPSPRFFSIEDAEKTRILSPGTGDHVSVRLAEGSELDGTPQTNRKVKLIWKANNPNQNILLSVYKLDPDKKGEKKVLEQVVSTKNGKGAVYFKASGPGAYAWEIRDEKGEPITLPENARAEFNVEKEFQAISVLEPLVAGKVSTSNRLKDKILHKFDVSVRWKPYRKVKNYKIQFYSTSTLDGLLYERVLSDTTFTFNRDRVFYGTLYYKITIPLQSEFVASTGVQVFRFEYLPPDLVAPKDQAEIGKGSIEAEHNRLLMTWEKTNFTVGYELAISEDEGFNKIVKKELLKENYYFFDNPARGEYWWRVSSISDEHSSRMSKANRFQVK